MVKTTKYITLMMVTLSVTVFCVFSGGCLVAEADDDEEVLIADTWMPSELLYQAMQLPFLTPIGDVIIDNFEYWDNPRNHGWSTNEPSYPFWGEGIGEGRLKTVLDTMEVGRVLNVYMVPSVFLPQLQRYTISKALSSPDPFSFISPDPDDPAQSPRCSYLSFKIRAPLTIEMFDTFTFSIHGTLKDHLQKDKLYYYVIQLIPREACPGCAVYDEAPVLISEPTDDPANPGIISVDIGRQYGDWTWHMIYVDVDDFIEQTLGSSGKYLRSLDFISIQGNRYRLDDIVFHSHDYLEEEPPYLYKIRPIFAQLFTPMQRLVFATDDFCNQNDVLIHPDDIRRAWREDGIDPNTKDLSIPVLADQKMRQSANNHVEDMLRFTAYIGKGGTYGSSAAAMIHPLKVDPDDNYPLFLPAYYRLMDEEEPVAHAYGSSHRSEGTFYYPAERVRNIELALKNAGYQYWPRVAVLEFNPQVLEDLIVTVEVSDGRSYDIETFPVSVVNYPVENYPPCMEDVDDQIAYVGEVFEYALSALDPDSCIYSPTHPKLDQFSLIWNMTLASLPSYRFGPWQESLINPHTGLIRFVPQFEGSYPVVVSIQDDRGLFSVGQFTIHCINRGTWLNHPPIVLGDWDHPQVCRAGELFTLSEPTMDVEDPDGDKIYYTCDIGCIGIDACGNAIWTFQTQFPGFYASNIVAMDIHGAFTLFTIHLEVRPWWSI